MSILSTRAAGRTLVIVGLLSSAFQCCAEPPPPGSPLAAPPGHKGFIMNAVAPVPDPPAPEKDPAKEGYLTPYEGFVRAAGARGQAWCCDMHDGRANLAERPADDGGVDVFATLEAFPKMFISEEEKKIVNGKEGKWVHIPPNKILSGDAIRETVKRCLKGPELNDLRGKWSPDTCNPPHFNMAWLQPNFGTPYCYYRGAPHDVYYDSGKHEVLAQKDGMLPALEENHRLYSLLDLHRFLPKEQELSLA